MKMSSSRDVGCLFLAAMLVKRASCQQHSQTSGIASAPLRMMRNLQDVPVVGVGFGPTADGDSLSIPSGSDSSPAISAVADELIEALEQDDQVTGEI